MKRVSITANNVEIVCPNNLSELALRCDGLTGGHLTRTQNYLHMLLRETIEQGLYQEELSDVDIIPFVTASKLHDLGKMLVPRRILLKRGKLTGEEFEVMKTHTTLGGDAIRCAMPYVKYDRFRDTAIAFALTHHEHWDGTGYPLGLSEYDIPIEGRLMAIVDVYDALTSKRVYKDPMPHEMARELVLSGRGAHFDPQLTDVFESASKVWNETIFTHN